MPYINGFLLICFSVLFVFITGLYTFITSREENECTMTYMFEYPQFVRISLPDSARKYKSYALYAYGEGRFTEKVREMRFDGIPVLFIHGHRGSYKQVRSLASVSLRKSLGSKTPFHFDYFTVDLNEEYSGFYGGVLRGQTDFVKIAIEKILKLYKTDNAPDSVVIVGHSMGGVVAKGLFVGDDFPWSCVRFIITLATPHSPPVLIDSHSADYYFEVKDLWDAPPEEDRGNLTLISIGGGPRDLVVHSSLTLTPHADISTITTAVSDVWLSADHLCILWCKELVFVLVRAIFDSVDSKTNQISKDPVYIRSVFEYHLLYRSAGNRFNSSIGGGVHPNEVTLWRGGSYDSGTWLRLKKSQLTWSKPDRLLVPTHIVINLASTTPADTLALHTVNHKTRDWIFACKADTTLNGIKICSRGENLSMKGRIASTKDFKRKTALIDLMQLRMEGKTHIVIRTLPTDEKVQISFDLFKIADRSINGLGGYMKSHEVLSNHNRVEGAMYYKILLPELSKSWQMYRLNIVSHDGNNCSSTFNLAHAQVVVPWSNEGSHYILSEANRVLSVNSFTPKPTRRDTKDAYVEVLLNPECSVSLKLEKSLLMSLASIISKNYVSVIPFIAVCLLMALSKQMKCLKEEGECPLILNVMPQASKPYYVFPTASIVGAIARYLPYMFAWVPLADVHHQNGLVETLYTPLLLHCSAVAISYLVAVGVLTAVVFQGQAFNGFLLKFMSKFCMGLPWLSEYVMAGFNKLPIIISAIMVAITYSASSGLAIYIGLVFYFVKLVSLYEDFWEEIVYWPVRMMKAIILANRFTKRKLEIPQFEIPPLKDLSFHLSILLLWLLIALICTPSVLVWARNYRYNSYLDNDPFFTSGLLLSACGGYLWQADVPRINLKYSIEISRLLLGCCVIIMVYCQVSLYRLESLLVAVIVLISAHQLMAPSLGEIEPKSRGPLSVAANNLAAHIAKILGGSEEECLLGSSASTSAAIAASSNEEKGTTSEEVTDQGTSRSVTSSENDERWPTKKDMDDVEEEVENLEDIQGGQAAASGGSSGSSSDPSADFGEMVETPHGSKSPSSDLSISSFENISLSDLKMN